MSRKLSLVLQISLFLLVTILGFATNYLANDASNIPEGLAWVLRWSFPVAALSIFLIIGLMVWQQAAEGRSATARPAWDSDRSPFPGLEAFTEHDAQVFFGRDEEVAELLERLSPVLPAKANRMVPIIGPSGVGKSSLVHAGLLPRLRRRRGSWIVLPTVVPEDRPLRSLARSLAAAHRRQPHQRQEPQQHPNIRSVDDIWGGLTGDGSGLPQILEELRAAHTGRATPILLIVDQAEELITLSGGAERSTFLELLADALAHDRGLWIILIMRSEFLTAFLGTEQARLFRDPMAVGTLGRAELVEVIERPAQRAGLSFDPPVLVQRMAAEAGDGQALPLLAYALQELYLATGPGGTVTTATYERIGGVAGVLSRQADKVTAELDRCADAAPVLPTLLKFVTLGQTEPTRRRVRRSTLTEAEWQVAEAFIAARLLTSDADGHDAALDVAHEALFVGWVPLRHAIEASQDQLRWRADLERWAMDWDNSGRREAYLLTGERLSTAQRWVEAESTLLAGLLLVEQFLAASARADLATMQRLSETLARQALSNLDQDPDYSLLLALTAFEECAPTPLALRALATALVASRIRAVLQGHDDWLREVAWSPDGSRLASTSGDRTARIWDAEDGRELLVLRGHDNWVHGVAWSPDGRRLATASSDRTARIWEVLGRAEPLVLRGHDDTVRSVSWSPDGTCLATCSSDGTARIWNARDGRIRQVLRGHDDIVRWVEWSPDGRFLATGSSDRTARIWAAHDGQEPRVLRGHDDEVRGIAWSPDSSRLATASADRTVRIWFPDADAEPVVLRGHQAWIWGVAWSPGGDRIASASDDETIRIWDAGTTGELVVLHGHQTWVRSVAWSPDGGRLATASNDRTVRVWALGEHVETTILYGHEAWIWSVAWSPDGGRLASASDDRTVRIWDPRGGAELTVVRGHESWVRGVAWSPDGRRLATASADWTARIWDAATGTELAVLRGHDDEVRGVTWSPDAHRVATSAGDRTIRIWDPAGDDSPVVLRGHRAWARHVAWSPDGRRLATASDDRTARIWDAATGTELAVLRGHDDEVRSITWSPDGSRVATGSGDRTGRVWDTATAAETVVIGAHDTGVESVAWCPDGERIASAAQDGSVRVWDATMSAEDLLTRARRRVIRRLTANERRDLLLPPEPEDRVEPASASTVGREAPIAP